MYMTIAWPCWEEEQPRTSVLYLHNEMPRLHRRRAKTGAMKYGWSINLSQNVVCVTVISGLTVKGPASQGSFSSHHETFACKPWCCLNLREAEEKIIKKESVGGENKAIKDKLVHVRALGSQKLPSASPFSGVAPTPLFCLCFNYHWLSPHLCSWITTFVFLEYHENVVCKWNKQKL